ncbi:uncharacterized protein LOC112024221 [Quercus suber]|uniref:uncharacterized protein LOC112024221 n=1 Tax=Quercus suber TaxID=58331 RepID=UPI0032E037B4
MSVSLAVMTFNLHEDQPPDSPNSWEKRRDLCISVITSYSPVILCTQQGVKSQLDYLHQCLSGKLFFPLTPQSYYFNAYELSLFNKKFKLKLLKIINNCYLMCPLCNLVQNDCDTLFLFRGQTRLLMAFLVLAFREHGVVGDMRDVWPNARVRKNASLIRTYHGFKGDKQGALEYLKLIFRALCLCWDRQTQDLHIDWILFRGRSLIPVSCEVVSDNIDGYYPSSHYPIFAEFMLPRTVRALEPPAREPPTLEPPTREPPTLEPPTQEPPALEPPAREPPTLESPAREPPTLESPAREPPT